jgi:hypothetical protein
MDVSGSTEQKPKMDAQIKTGEGSCQAGIVSRDSSTGGTCIKPTLDASTCAQAAAANP